jgi:hypothetical protein
MNRSFKGVRGGTPSGEPLCRSCAFAHYRSGQRQKDTEIFCSSFNPTIRLSYEMFDCSDYQDNRMTQVYDLLGRAWILVPLKKGHKWVKSDELRKMEQEGVVPRVDIED